jgi:hypothetical protein
MADKDNDSRFLCPEVLVAAIGGLLSDLDPTADLTLSPTGQRYSGNWAAPTAERNPVENLGRRIQYR